MASHVRCMLTFSHAQLWVTESGVIKRARETVPVLMSLILKRFKTLQIVSDE